jgi:hypothetical protein
LRLSHDVTGLRKGEPACESSKGHMVRHVQPPPGFARKDLFWMAVAVLLLFLWLVAVLSGWLEPLGWE